MISDVLSHTGNAFWPGVALILFFLVFVGVVIRTYRGRRDRFDYMSRLPLDESENPVSASGEYSSEPEWSGKRS